MPRPPPLRIKKELRSLDQLITLLTGCILITAGSVLHYKSAKGTLLTRYIGPEKVEEAQRELNYMAYDLPDWADQWCLENDLPPLNYQDCSPDSILNIIPMMEHDIEQSLKLLLFGAIASATQDRCFHIDTRGATFLQYFEPVGLPKYHPVVQSAMEHGRIQVLDRIQDDLNLLSHKEKHTIPNLKFIEDMDGLVVKKLVLKQLWRPKQNVRQMACVALSEKNVGKAFITISIPPPKHRKEPLEKYVEATEFAVRTQFDDKVPNIFVATNDCSNIDRLKSLRPEWTFEGECGEPEEIAAGETSEITGHFRQWMIQIYACATGTYFIGEGLNDLSWFAFFLRGYKHSFLLVDVPIEPHKNEELFDFW